MITEVKMEVITDLSKRVQEIVFENGGEWFMIDKIVKYLDAKYLYISINKSLSFNSDTEFFKKDKFKEVSAYDFIASQGEQYKLPKFGEKIEVSDDNVIWVKNYFDTYSPKNNYPIRTTKNRCHKYWRPIKKTKTIVIDGKDIEISEESYKAFIEQFGEEK